MLFLHLAVNNSTALNKLVIQKRNIIESGIQYKKYIVLNYIVYLPNIPLT